MKEIYFGFKVGIGVYLSWNIMNGLDRGLGRIFGKSIKRALNKNKYE